MAVRREVQKRGAKSALSLFKEKLGNVKNRRAPVVRNNNQVGPTRTAKQKKDAIIDGDFTDITPKKGFTKKQLAALITGGSIVTLGALNAMSPAKLEEVAADADADADTKPKKGKGETAAEKAARLKKLREDQAKVNASNPGSPGNKVTTKTKATTTTAGKGKGKLFKKFRPFGGVIARALLGDDEKFGGERGMIDFIRLKKKQDKTPTETAKMKVMAAAQKKLKAAEKKAAADVAKAKQKAKGLKNGGMAKKPVKKNMGGMMKKKGYSKGGAMKKKGYSKGGVAKKKKGYAMGGQASKFPDLNKDGKVTQADILKGRGVAKKNMGGSMKKKGYAKGGMTKKGYANGGMAKKGYANGGPAKKTTAKKTASRGKARGVGAATRGYGATMR